MSQYAVESRALRKSLASRVVIPDPIPFGLLNWGRDLILPFQNKLLKAMAGTAACVWNIPGDSTALGTVGGTSDPTSYTSGMPYKIFNELVRRGIPARYDGCSASTRYNGGGASLDGRWTGTALTNFSGYLLNCAGLGVNVQTWTPTKTSDSFAVTWLDLSAAGTLRVKCNGGTNQDVASTNSGTFKRSVFTAAASGGALGANPWTFEGSAGVYIYMVEAWDSTVKDVRVLNTGVPGIATRDQSVSVLNCPLNGQLTAGGDIFTPIYGVNDSTGSTGSNGSGTYVAQYLSAMQRVIAAFTPAKTLAVGPMFNMNIADAILDTYRAQFLAAIGTTVPAYDMRLRFGNNSTLIKASGVQTDDLHPTSSLYDFNARFIVHNLLDLY